MRKSSRISSKPNRYYDDEIEIIGDTKLERKRGQKVDQNFAKMTLKDQRAAAEAFNNSILYEEEEESSRRTSKRNNKGRKRKQVAEESDDDDIEVLDVKHPSSVVKKNSNSTEDDSDSDIEVLQIDDEEEKVKFSETVTITKTTKKNVDEKLLAEEFDLVKSKSDLVEVKDNGEKRCYSAKHSPNNAHPNCNFDISLPLQIKDLDYNMIVMQAPAAELYALKQLNLKEKQYIEAKKTAKKLIQVAIDILLKQPDVKILLMERVPRYAFQY